MHVHGNHPGTWLIMQILTQVWGGAWDSICLTGSQEMLILLGQESHSSSKSVDLSSVTIPVTGNSDIGGNSLSDKNYFWNPVSLLPTKAQASPTPFPLAWAWTNHKSCPYPLGTGQISWDVQKRLVVSTDGRKEDGRAGGREQGKEEERRREERKGMRTERKVRKMPKAKALL